MSLKKSDICIANGKGIVTLNQTKTGFRDVVPISDRLVLSLCMARLNQICDGDLFVGHSSRKATSILYDILHTMGLQQFGFKFYSFRRGGATYFFRKTGNMEETLVRGRWESSRTARLYITDGMRLLATMALSSQSLEMIGIGTHALLCWQRGGYHRHTNIFSSPGPQRCISFFPFSTFYF